MDLLDYVARAAQNLRIVETKTALSYAGIAIKAERLRYASTNSLTRVKGRRKLEKLYRETCKEQFQR